MGCDIHGFVELDTSSNDPPEYTRWRGLTNIEPHTGRSYDTFGCLFGVRNYAQFDPVAADRGVPDDAGHLTRREYERHEADHHSATYLTYPEIQSIDWNATADELDSRYSILDENKEPTGTKFSLGPASGWADIVDENRERIDAGEPVPGPDGDRYIQRRELTRDEAVSGAWRWLLEDYMGMLADRYGEDRVRGVVWFDN